MNVSSLMHQEAITCGIHDSLERAAQLMWDHDIGCLPIVEDDGRVIGMVTDRDICMAAYTTGQPLRAIPVGTPMARVVYSCTPSDDLQVVEQVMQQRQLHRMPVLDGGGKPIAVISLNDIARAAQNDGVPANEVAATLAAVSAPRAPVAAST